MNPRRDASAAVERAHELWSDGNRRAALQLLKEAVRSAPQLTGTRRALAQMYREMGCPDQAGRWGISILGWTTPLERDRLARLLASSWVAREDLRTFLALPADPDTFAQLRVIVGGPVESYRRKWDAEARARIPETPGSDRLFAIAAIGSTVTIVVWILGLLAVFGVAVLELADPKTFASRTGGVIFALSSLTLLTSFVAAVVERWWKTAVAFGIGGALCATLAFALITSS